MCSRILSWILWTPMTSAGEWAQGASPGPSSCPRPPWHYYRKSAKHLEEAQISSDMFLPFIRKIVKRPCHTIPARKVSSPWVPWLEAGSKVECQSMFLQESLLFSKPLSLCPETASSNFAYEAAAKKWLGEKKKSKHSSSFPARERNRFYHLINTSHQSILICPLFWSNSQESLEFSHYG